VTKKDYEAFAQIIREIRVVDTDENYQDAVKSFIDKSCLVFKKDNPRFSSERFRKACEE
jgi:hypothetical protein